MNTLRSPAAVGAALLLLAGTTIAQHPLFATPTSRLSGSASAIVVGDLDGDGVPDAVTSVAISWSQVQFRTRLGRGDGTFAWGAGYAMPRSSYPSDLTLVDMDGDQDLDLLACHGERVTVHLNNGKGSLALQPTLVGARGLVCASAGDLNGDGRVDVVTTSGSKLYVLVQSATGGFSPTTYAITGRNDGGVAIGDMDNDGKVDIVCSAGIFRGTGTTPAFALKPISGLSSSRFSLADLNKDGRLDIVMIVSLNTLKCLNSTSTPLTYFSRTIGPTLGYGDHSIGDVDGDGDLDIAYTANDSQVRIARNNGAGVFVNPSTPQQILRGGTGATGVSMLDVDGNSTPDIVACTQTAKSINVFLNSGKGVLRTADYQAFSAKIQALETGDIDGDGDVDIVGVGQAHPTLGGLYFRLNNGVGKFAPAPPLIAGPGQRYSDLVLRDLNGDRTLDAIATSVHWQGASYVSVFLNQRTKLFGPPTNYRTQSNPGQVVLADISGDGVADMLVSHPRGPVSVWLGKTNGAFLPRTDISVSPWINGRLAVRDLNGDGRVDLIVPIQGKAVVFMLNTGKAPYFQAFPGLKPGNHIQLPNSVDAVATGDLDGKGSDDLVVTAGPKVLVYLSSSTKPLYFSVPKTYSGIGRGFQIEVTDVDGDGDRDVTVAGRTHEANFVYLNDSTGNLGAPVAYTGGTGHFDVKFADLDGDSHKDMVTIAAGERITIVPARPFPKYSWPGTNEDLEIFTGRNGVVNGGPGYDRKKLPANQILTIKITSPNRTFMRDPLFLMGQLRSTGAKLVPWSLYKGLQMDPLQLSSGSGMFMFLIRWTPPNFPVVLGPKGVILNLPLVPSLVGNTLRLQAAIISPKAKNSGIAFSPAHDILITK
jgi:FG-GAP-like repeat